MVSSIRVEHGDCREVIKTLADASVDACVTDPPYSLVSIQKRFGKPGQAPAAEGVYRRGAAGFMGKQWDTGETAFDPAFWAEVLRALKPGAHLVAFGGTRTYHRLACAIEDAGFEIRDQIGWAFGSGFPKSHDVSKGIDKAAGAERETIAASAGRPSGLHRGRIADYSPANADDFEPRQSIPATDAARQWQGWGTALKPAWEPICLARKPLGEKTVAANVLAHGTGALNIDGCRVSAEGETFTAPQSDPGNRMGIVGIAMQATGSAERNQAAQRASIERTQTMGRWPANLIHDGGAEVLAGFPDSGNSFRASRDHQGGNFDWKAGNTPGFDDSGTAARFFYTAKADKADRLLSKHPTVKPVDLMAYLVRLVTPPGGTVLDPFAGSGSTGMACMREGFDCVMIEREAEYVADINYRLQHVDGGDTSLFAAPVKVEQLSLFDPYDDGWPDAAANSKGCYDVAIEAMREEFLKNSAE